MSTNNYFRVGRSVFFFDSKDYVSTVKAWDAAGRVKGGDAIAVYRPFLQQGPWTNCDVIGFAEVGSRPADDSPLLELWQIARNLREALWGTMAWHVNTAGNPTI